MDIDIVNHQPFDLAKYREAAAIADEALQYVASICIAGSSIADICRAGDQLMTSHLSKIYKSGSIVKGISMPVCINVNNIVRNYSPRDDESVQLRGGDLCKIELGVHIDGYVAECGHTIIVESSMSVDGPVTGPVADVVCASYFAAEIVARKLSAGMGSEEIIECIEKCAGAFGVKPIVGVVCAATKRFVTNHPQKTCCIVPIANGPDADEQLVNMPFTVGENEAYIVSVGMTSSDEVAPYEAGDMSRVSSLYCRNVEQNSCVLKLESAKEAIQLIQRQASVFPFSTRDFSAKARLGMQECMQKRVVDFMPVKQLKRGTVTAQFKFTVIVGGQGVASKLTDAKIPLPYVHSDCALTEDLQNIINMPIKSLASKTSGSGVMEI